ncbi:MAG TPA: response regulator transcription factor [Candidatus Sulfotelmatobacter sp.]|nr:response regulator transcription factor [Candidatus Sulfotelmatobacter sp.]
MAMLSAETQTQKPAPTPYTKTLRILVADDHDILRRGLKQLLTSHAGWQVCAEARTGREAVSLAEEYKPDIVVIDIGMPDLNGLEAARRIRKALPKIGIIILTLHFSDQLVKDIVEAGARAYVMKADADRDLVNAVEALANHRTFFTARAAEMLLNDFSDRVSATIAPAPANPRSRLTSREREIVQLLAEGKSSKEVAAVLGISVKTAETHRANIMRKLQVHSVSELVRYAIKNGIIEA